MPNSNVAPNPALKIAEKLPEKENAPEEQSQPSKFPVEIELYAPQ